MITEAAQATSLCCQYVTQHMPLSRPNVIQICLCSRYLHVAVQANVLFTPGNERRRDPCRDPYGYGMLPYGMLPDALTLQASRTSPPFRILQHRSSPVLARPLGPRTPECLLPATTAHQLQCITSVFTFSVVLHSLQRKDAPSTRCTRSSEPLPCVSCCTACCCTALIPTFGRSQRLADMSTGWASSSKPVFFASVSHVCEPARVCICIYTYICAVLPRRLPRHLPSTSLRMSHRCQTQSPLPPRCMLRSYEAARCWPAGWLVSSHVAARGITPFLPNYTAADLQVRRPSRRSSQCSP